MKKLALVLAPAAMSFACGSAGDESGLRGLAGEVPALDSFAQVRLPGDGSSLTTPPALKHHRGINLNGAEFGSALPGVEGKDYSFPTTAQVDYFLGKGMNTIRLGFKWERLQPAALGVIAPVYFGKLDALVAYATSKGATVILNPHNFARYYGTTVGSASVPANVFANLWSRLAAHYKTNPNVVFNLVNEPNNMPTEQWVSAANAAIAAIRATGAANVIHVPGNSWTGAHSWYGPGYGTPNATAMLDIVDPIDNSVFEVHQYMDADSGGENDQCMSTTIGADRLVKFVGWLKQHEKRGFVGELAGGRNQQCYAAVTNMLTYIENNSDVLEGWLWWAAGPGWGDYMFTLEPKNGVDRPQMALLLPYLGK